MPYRKANGNFNTALQTLRQDENELQYFELFTAFMRLCYARNIIEINDWVEQVAGMGRERQKQLMDYSLRFFRENFMLHLESNESELYVGKGGGIFMQVQSLYP